MKVGDLASGDIVAVDPQDPVRSAAKTMVGVGVGSAVVLADEKLAGIITERDVLRAVAGGLDLDTTAAEELMTSAVVTVAPDAEIYDAAAEMAARRIRHLVVADGDRVIGVVSVRDVLLAGERVPLPGGDWAVLRDPLTFTIRERRKLQRYLLQLRGDPDGDDGVDDLLGLLVGSWSLKLSLPPDAEALRSLPAEQYASLRATVLAELPELQRATLGGRLPAGAARAHRRAHRAAGATAREFRRGPAPPDQCHHPGQAAVRHRQASSRLTVH